MPRGRRPEAPDAGVDVDGPSSFSLKGQRPREEAVDPGEEGGADAAPPRRATVNDTLQDYARRAVQGGLTLREGLRSSYERLDPDTQAFVDTLGTGAAAGSAITDYQDPESRIHRHALKDQEEAALRETYGLAPAQRAAAFLEGFAEEDVEPTTGPVGPTVSPEGVISSGRDLMSARTLLRRNQPMRALRFIRQAIRMNQEAYPQQPGDGMLPGSARTLNQQHAQGKADPYGTRAMLEAFEQIAVAMVRKLRFEQSRATADTTGADDPDDAR